MKMIKKYYENETFIIDKKDSKLFDRAKEISENIYFLIEELEFLRVDFVIESDLEKEKRKMRKMTDKQEKIFDDLMDMYEFEVYENDEGKLQVNDLQGANLGGICGEVFDNKFDIIERMNIYHNDYIIAPLEWEFDMSFDTVVEWLDFLIERKNKIENQEDDWDYTIEILKFIILCDESSYN